MARLSKAINSIMDSEEKSPDMKTIAVGFGSYDFPWRLEAKRNREQRRARRISNAATGKTCVSQPAQIALPYPASDVLAKTPLSCQLNS
jgi:hypothetical protein